MCVPGARSVGGRQFQGLQARAVAEKNVGRSSDIDAVPIVSAAPTAISMGSYAGSASPEPMPVLPAAVTTTIAGLPRLLDRVGERVDL